MDQSRHLGVAAFEAGLLARQSGCVTCPESTPPCPSCPKGQSCQITVPVNCTQCPRAFCAVNQPTTATPSSSSGSAGPGAGAIAGGVVGALAAIAFLTYLVWRFCIKNKRQAPAQRPDLWDEEDHARDEREKSFAQRRDQRASTHTVGSVASTVLTRASNIIQIAYIPGVTNRAAPQSPTVLVPPVPPIPVAHAGAPSSTQEDDHFFLPGNLRDSSYSGMSGYTDRTSFARASYAPRSSIASTIYGRGAVVQAPALTGMRAKPTVVSMKSNGSDGSGTATPPPVPAVNHDKSAPSRQDSPTPSTFSVASAFLNKANAHTAMPARAQVVRVGNGSGPRMAGPKMVDAAAKAAAVPAKPEGPVLSTPPPSSSARAVARRAFGAITTIEELPSPAAEQGQSPFSDPPAAAGQEEERRGGHKSSHSLSAVIGEATQRASRGDSTKLASSRDPSPFSDDNAAHVDR